ncbi:MAG: pantothenate kinase, type [Acidimicrobiaceae bacterium]|nr:pantothenate kinase, type [Acidimicrobiaceae bacterium]
MLLAIDVGNTQTVVGVFAGEISPVTGARAAGSLPGLLHSWRLATVPARTADELVLILRQLLDLAGLGLPGLAGAFSGREPDGEIEGMVLSSSVPPVTATVAEMASRWLDVPLVVVGPGTRTGMPVRYDNPREVGPDRIVNAVGALDLYSAPLIVVDLGTATTFDAVSGAGEYLGGAIVPGLEISMDALYSHAAALPRVALGEPRRAIGRSTVESMQAGAIFGHAALVDGMCERINEELGGATVLATGGLGGLVVPHARRVSHYEPWLTLHGLRLLYELNAPGVAAGPRRRGAAEVSW